MKVLTIGSAMQDIFITHEKAEVAHLDRKTGKKCYLILQEGVKIEIQHVDYFTGGGATNTAVSFARLGHEVTTVCKVGQDDPGNFIIQELESQGVNTDHVIVSDQHTTGVSFILPCPSGDRTVLVYRGASVTMNAYDLPANLFAGSDLLYVTALAGPLAPLLPALVYAAHKAGVSVAVNPGTGQLKAGTQALVQSLKDIDILILNAYEACLLWSSLQGRELSLPCADKKGKAPHLLAEGNNHFDVRGFCRDILSRGPHTVVVTNGAEGVYAAHKNTLFFHPSVPDQVISTVGAGDAFASCFVATLSNGYDYAVRAGVLNAASVINAMGAKTGLLSLADLERRLKALDQSLLQRVSL